MKITVVGAVLVIAAGIAIVLLAQYLNRPAQRPDTPNSNGGTSPEQP